MNKEVIGMSYTKDEGLWSKRNWILLVGLIAGLLNIVFGITIGEEFQLEIATFIESAILFVMSALAWWSKQKEKDKLKDE